jgi:predicted DNA-binding protein
MLYRGQRGFTMTAQMIVRIDSDLKARVNNVAKAEGKSVSEVVRELLEEYVKTRDIGSYIDNLWSRIGGKLTSSGFTPKDVKSVIGDVRAKR